MRIVPGMDHQSRQSFLRADARFEYVDCVFGVVNALMKIQARPGPAEGTFGKHGTLPPQTHRASAFLMRGYCLLHFVFYQLVVNAFFPAPPLRAAQISAFRA
jgi:hypothetical protein